MSWQYVQFTPVLFVAAVAALLAAAFLWGRHRTPGGAALTAVLVGVGGWTLAVGVQHAHADLAGKVVAAQVATTVVAFLPVAWVVFAYRFSARAGAVSRRTVALLCVVPATTAAAVWLSPGVPLFWQTVGLETVGEATHLTVSYGPAFVLHVAYSYVLVAAGGVAAGRRAIKTTDSDQLQGALVLAAVLAPWVGNVVAILDVTGPAVDPMPLAAAAAGLVFTGVVTRSDLLDVPPAARPFARDTAVGEVAEGLLVLTTDGVVTDCNPAAASFLDVDRTETLGRPLASVAPAFADAIEAVDSDSRDGSADAGSTTRSGDDAATSEAHVVHPSESGDRHYDVRTAEFSRRGLDGSIVTLADVTQRHRHRRRMGVLNRILRHDLRNEMNVVMGYAELLEDDLQRYERSEQLPSTDSPQSISGDGGTAAIDRIRTAASAMLDLSTLVREVESTLDADGAQQTVLDGAGLVRAQVDGAGFEWPEARITLDAPESAWMRANDLVDTAFENVLENAVKHSHREHPAVHVTVETIGDRVVTTVEDDGPGIPEQELATFRADGESQLTHSSGMGLWLVIWLVEESGGDVSFDVDETGTTVTIRLPAADPPTDV